MKRSFVTLTLALGFLNISAHALSKTKDLAFIPENQKSTVDNFIATHKEQWLKEDLAMLTPAPTKEHSNGWTLRDKKIKDHLNLSVYERFDSHGKGNKIFYYWNDTELDLPLSVTAKMFSSWFDLAKNWTKETKETQKVYVTPNGEEIWYQLFMTPFILKSRKLISVCVNKTITPEDLANIPQNDISLLNAELISCRSISSDISKIKNTKSSAISIGWRGAYLLTESEIPGTTKVRKIDREIIGGIICGGLMNIFMPKYLNEEVEKAVKYAQTHKDELVQRALRIFSN